MSQDADLTLRLQRCFRRRYRCLDAQDVGQAVALGVWLARQDWQPQGMRFEAWALRRCRAELRRVLRASRACGEASLSWDVGGVGATPETLVAAVLEEKKNAMQSIDYGTRAIKPGMDAKSASPRVIRQLIGVSQLQVAARAGVSMVTVRLYEADPESVKADTRAKLSPVYREMAEASSGKAAAQ